MLTFTFILLVFVFSDFANKPLNKDVRLPQQMQRAMAAEAESTRDARAKVHSQHSTDHDHHNYHDHGNDDVNQPGGHLHSFLTSI